MFLAASTAAASMSGATHFNLKPVDYVIFAVYLITVLGIGWALKKHIKSSEDFLLSGRSIPGWVTALAFISANLGAQELIGMVASGAEYGMMTSHFYWVGAIPAMLFLGVFMMPMYYGSKARSVPEYLKLRYDDKTRAFNSISFAILTVSSSGISMFALADLANALLGVDFTTCLLVTSAVVLIYVLKGGLTSALYTEVVQFFMIVFGFAPLAWVALQNVGGWDGLVAKLTASGNEGHLHSWTATATSDNLMGTSWYGIIIGLGFVLSFGYWTTNFAEVQRAMAAKDMGAARRTPILGAIPKMLFPAVVILPGMIAFALTGDNSGYEIPEKLNAAGVMEKNYNLVLPTMIQYFFPNGMLGLALTALIASFMSGMAANVTAFNTVWTYDIYQSIRTKWLDIPKPYTLTRENGSTEEVVICPKPISDAHMMNMGRLATVFGILASIGFAYFARNYNNILEVLQLMFGFVNAPLFATFLLGMFTRRSNNTGAFYGLLIGTAAAVIFHGCSYVTGNLPGAKGGWIVPEIAFAKGMAQTFAVATVAFTVTFVMNLVISLMTPRTKTDEDLKGLVYSLTPKHHDHGSHFLTRPAVLSVGILVICLILNILFW